MRYNREEPFRYTFDEPIAALFQIREISGHLVDTAEGAAKIIDISTEGMKINSALDIPDSKSIHLSVSFELNGAAFDTEGCIVWKKDRGHTHDYGIDLLTEAQDRKHLITQLKVYSKKALTGN